SMGNSALVKKYL
ncbi:matrix protein 1, partial [Influenza B virus]